MHGQKAKQRQSVQQQFGNAIGRHSNSHLQPHKTQCVLNSICKAPTANKISRSSCSEHLLKPFIAMLKCPHYLNYAFSEPQLIRVSSEGSATLMFLSQAPRLPERYCLDGDVKRGHLTRCCTPEHAHQRPHTHTRSYTSGAFYIGDDTL